MEITDAAVRLVPPRKKGATAADGHLLAFVNLVFDGQLAVRGIKVLRRADGSLFAGMPDRRVEDYCPGCGFTNGLQDRFCRSCGQSLDPSRSIPADGGKVRLFQDVVHPVDREAREYIEGHVLEAYYDEAARLGVAVPAPDVIPAAPLAGRIQKAS